MSKVAASNLPRHADKRALIAPDRRPGAAVNSWNRRGITRVGIAELTGDAARVIDRRKRWDVVLAPPNNDFGHLTIQNGIAYRRDVEDCIDRGHLRQAVRGRPRGLNFAAGLFENAHGLEVHIEYHAIRAKENRAANREAAEMVADYGLKCYRTGLPVTLTGDANWTDIDDYLRRRGYSIGATGDVMVVAGLGIDWLGRPSAPSVNWSDHKVPARRYRPDAPTSTARRQPRRLPQP